MQNKLTLAKKHGKIAYDNNRDNIDYIDLIAVLYGMTLKENTIEENEALKKLMKKSKDLLNLELNSEIINKERIKILIKTISYMYSTQAENDFLKCTEAIKWHESVLKHIVDANFYLVLGILYSRENDTSLNLELSKKYVEKALELDPNDEKTKTFLWQLLKYRIKNNQIADEFGEDINRKNKEDNEIFKWMKNDLNNIIDYLNDHEIQFIVQNYPFYYFDNIEKVCKDRDVVFINQYNHFNLNKETEEEKKKYLFPDKHCNEAGNKKIAENLLPVVKKMLNLN
jgi:hypothetical protein